MKKSWNIVLILLVLAAVAGWAGYTLTRPPGEIVLTGIVTTDEVIVSPEIQGRLQQLFVREGDTVTNGELLAVIQPQEQEANMAFFASSERQTTADLAQAQADLENARLNFERIQGLYSNNVEPVQTYDQARTAFQSASARVESVKKQIQAADAQKEKAAVQLDRTKIAAPAAGIVNKRAALQGEVVSPGKAIVTLVDQDNLWVRADVEETYADKIPPGTKLHGETAVGRDTRRDGVLPRRGRRLRHAARREPDQARHQDV